MTPEMKALLEQMRDNPGAVSSHAAAGAAGAALDEIERLRADREADDMALAWRAYNAAWKDAEAGVRARDPRVVMYKSDVKNSA